MPVARKCFAQFCIRLSAWLCLQLCIHKLPKLITLCFLAVRVLNFGVKHVCVVGTLTFASFCNALHVIKTSWSAFGCCRSCGELLPFRLGLHQSLAVLCPLVLKRLLGQLDWFSHLRFRVAIVLAAAYIDCTAVPPDLNAQALVITSVEHMQHVLFRLGHRSQVYQLVGQIASNHTRCTVDRNIRARTSNSLQLSLPPPRGHKEIDRRSAVLLTDILTKTCWSFPFESLVRALLLDN